MVQHINNIVMLGLLICSVTLFSLGMDLSQTILDYNIDNHVLLLQRDTTSLSSENHELKYRLQTMEQQVQLQDGKHRRVIPQL